MTTPNTIIADLAAEVEALRQQRDELLRVLENVGRSIEAIRTELDGELHCSTTTIISRIDDAITSAKGGAPC